MPDPQVIRVLVPGPIQTIRVSVPGPTGPEGTVGWEGAYAALTAYNPNDIVSYQGSSWFALQATTGNAPPSLPTTSNSYWSLVAAKGDTGATGAQGEQGIQGIQGIQGEVGPQGEQGETGPQGPQGEQGIQGEPGGVTTFNTRNGAVTLESSDVTGALGFVSIKDFGAVGDDSTDNADAIQDAIDAAAASGKWLAIPEGVYRYSQTLVISETMQVVGMGGEASVLRYTGSGVALRLAPSTTTYLNNTFWGVRDVKIDHATAGMGTGGVSIVTTDSEFLSNFEIVGCNIGSFGGPGLLFDNQTSPEIGSMFCFTVRRNFITNGIKIIKGGDSMTIAENTIHGAGYGIEATVVTGARQFVVRNNNFTALGGLLFTDCLSLAFDSNWVELPSYIGDYTGPNDGLLKLANCPGSVIRRNTFQPLASVAVSADYAIELDSSCADVEFEGNEIGTGELGHVLLGSAPRSLFRRNNREMSGGSFVFSGAHATAINEVGNVPLLASAQDWSGAQTFLDTVTLKKGTINSQVVLEQIRWGTGQRRWEWILMADASLGLYFYDASGNIISAFFWDQSGFFTSPLGYKFFDPVGHVITMNVGTTLTANRSIVFQMPDSDVNVKLPASGILATTNKRVATAQTGAVGTPTINVDLYDIFPLTGLTAAITSLTTGLTGTPVHGQEIVIQFTGTASRAITHGSSYEASTVALPTTTSGTAMLEAGYRYNSATSKWRCIRVA